MLKHVHRIFRSDFRSWVPTIVVIGLVTTLIGACMHQFVWTNSDGFVTAATDAGLDPAAFGVVSVTIYVLVAVLSFFALTVVGSATVERTRSTFAQWRLAGASPRQIRVSLWSLVGLASVAGALPGSLLSVGLSVAAIPLFNQMAAASFPGGIGGFEPPAFHPSALAWAASFSLGVVTCMLGALLPSRRAAGVEPVEAVRGLVTRGRRGAWARWLLGGLLLAVAFTLAFAGALAPAHPEVGVEATGMVNAAIQAGLFAAAGVYVLGAELAPTVLALARTLLRPFRGAAVGVLATRSARANIDTNANVIAPLAAAIGLVGVIFSVMQSYQVTMREAGFPQSSPNYSDTVVMTGLFGFVCLLTSIAVITLSGRDAVREQALLRTAGMTPRQVFALTGWQSFLLALCVAVFALVPIGIAGSLLMSRSALLVGHPILDIPWIGLTIAVLACWGTVFLVQWVQIVPWVRRENALSLRRA
ncbi:putative ABC transport system permease protein [Sinosporangium album]|uniref:Putative ABC transport system permease protein n=1 Tax=Sinosporangium album TaxID=504805 RepID=A0A1G8HNR1_9ACTN|nr:ABC transporter permease [Sinosporangium album]SDI08326.1 putative ABC transport system permease protein [Sinosporangium album]